MISYKTYTILSLLILLLFCNIGFAQETRNGNRLDVTSESAFFNIVLGRPTDKSVTISLLPIKNLSLYVEYKNASESSYTKTEVKIVSKATPLLIELTNLTSNSRYSYHIAYSENTGSGYTTGEEHSFQTKRIAGSTFSFTIEADPHPYDKKGSHTLWDICFKNQLNDNPDFMLDLGDTFGDDHTPLTTTSEDMKQLHLDNRAHFGVASHSVPLYFCIGNHEGESGYYLLQTPPNNIGITGTIWRKYYYPNPEPNSFYSGNTTLEGNGIGLPQNYYAWEWGDALFVVLDAYRYYTVSAKPRNWDWTLGFDQYKWFKQTLEASKAKFKFVFIHHILGETRGGSVVANQFEWGGYNAKGDWEFSAMRPGWELPIHQLMVKNGVNIFFQGHDHLYAKEMVDGIVYQEVPMPSDSTYKIGTTDNGDAFTDLKIDASGHLRVTVSPQNVKVDYVRAWLPKDENTINKNGEIAHSYTVLPKTTSVEKDNNLPSETSLKQNFPNPFNPSTVIEYQIPAAGHVKLIVYDALGREVALLVDEYKQKGSYQSVFNAFQYLLSSGIYFYQLKTNNYIITKKAILMK